LSDTTDHSHSPKTLPLPELNPLLNPILGEHMGRWAEVYFTAPPEKREEAVQALLRELESEHALDQASADPVFAPNSATGQISSLVDSGPMRVCDSCGHKNSPEQRFCGMCGAAIESHSLPRTDSQSASPFVLLQTASDHSRVGEQNQVTDRYESISTESEVDSSENNLDYLFASEQPSYSYRVIAAGVLALVAVALAFTAWRTVQPRLSRFTRPTPPVEVRQPAPSAPTAAASSASAPASTPAPTAAPASAPVSQPASEAEAKIQEPHHRPGRHLRNASQPAIKAADTAQLTQTRPASGSEELAIAQDYMSGTNGRARDHAAAVQWLWQAVSKKNTDATLLLADLYIKGDGVAKSCDQARVLLDAAALKGRKDASFRLRHLQAFGCQ
jgi:TPR repeat protein